MKNILQIHRFCLIAILVLAFAPVMMFSPASSAAVQDKITTARAASLHKYIAKAFSKIEQNERPQYKDLLVSRLHLCALVNRLIAANTRQNSKKRTAHLVKFEIFTKLITLMSDDYSNDQSDDFSTQAQTQMKHELLGTDSAKLQIVFNSCIDIQSGKITHALSNMDKKPTQSASSN